MFLRVFSIFVFFGCVSVLAQKGEETSLKPLSFGSLIDQVPNRGNYDDPDGSMASPEVSEVTNKMKIKHPLEIIIFANEERDEIAALSEKRWYTSFSQRINFYGRYGQRCQCIATNDFGLQQKLK